MGGLGPGSESALVVGNLLLQDAPDQLLDDRLDRPPCVARPLTDQVGEGVLRVQALQRRRTARARPQMRLEELQLRQVEPSANDLFQLIARGARGLVGHGGLRAYPGSIVV